MPKIRMSAETRAKIRQMRSQMAKNKEAMKAIADKLETEKRGYTDEERSQMDNLRTSNQQLSASIEYMEAPTYEPVQERADREMATADLFYHMRYMGGIPDKYRHLRADGSPAMLIIPESAAAGERLLTRADGDGGTTETTPVVQSLNTVTPIVPITMHDIVEPLSHLLIYDKVGLRVQHGISGQWNFPVVSGIEATFLDENVEVTDSKIELSKITPSPKRYSISVPVSNLAIIQSNGGIRNIVLNGITLAVANLINKVTFSTTQVGTANVFPTGAFVNCSTKQTAGAKALTYKECVTLKYTVIGKGVQGAQYGCYVCTPATYAELATTPKDAGSGLMVLENGMIDGTPVFMTTDFDDNKLGYGVFSYDVCGFFGNQTLGVDATSKDAMKVNMTYFVLNGHMDLACLRNEAFAYITKKA